jgi:hypothetical protein
MTKHLFTKFSWLEPDITNINVPQVQRTIETDSSNKNNKSIKEIHNTWTRKVHTQLKRTNEKSEQANESTEPTNQPAKPGETSKSKPSAN